MTATERMMWRDEKGRLLCASCGRRAKLGWVYKFGTIQLATCFALACRPHGDPSWIIGAYFRPATKREKREQLEREASAVTT